MAWQKLVAGRNKLPLPGGFGLRLLPAMEVLEARGEGLALSKQGGREEALCANACVLARALVKRGQPVFPSGEAVLRGLSVSQILRLTRLWAAFDREENPGPEITEEEVDHLKKAWSTRPGNACAGVYSAILGRCPFRRGR